jgi:glycosyltransferase involved in cell wall biosynthesis
MIDDVAVLIPSYNESAIIKKTVNQLRKHFTNIIVINDGSTDNSREILEKLDIVVINHPYNLGQGASIVTGINYIVSRKIDFFITFDADGQHRTEDALLLAKKIKSNKFDIIFSSRFLNSNSNVPRFKRMLLKTALHFTNIITNMNLTDTHNGLKAFKSEAFKDLNLTIPRYGFETELIFWVSDNKLIYTESSAEITYSKYSMQKGQSLLNAFIIFEDIMKLLFKRVWK